MIAGVVNNIKNIKRIFRDYLSIFIIHAKEVMEYKKATLIFYMSNLIYIFSGILAIYFVSLHTSLFSPKLGALLLFSSYLMFDISKFLRFDKDAYSLKVLIFPLSS